MIKAFQESLFVSNGIPSEINDNMNNHDKYKKFAVYNSNFVYIGILNHITVKISTDQYNINRYYTDDEYISFIIKYINNEIDKSLYKIFDIYLKIIQSIVLSINNLGDKYIKNKILTDDRLISLENDIDSDFNVQKIIINKLRDNLTLFGYLDRNKMKDIILSCDMMMTVIDNIVTIMLQFKKEKKFIFNPNNNSLFKPIYGMYNYNIESFIDLWQIPADRELIFQSCIIDNNEYHKYPSFNNINYIIRDHIKSEYTKYLKINYGIPNFNTDVVEETYKPIRKIFWFNTLLLCVMSGLAIPVIIDDYDDKTSKIKGLTIAGIVVGFIISLFLICYNSCQSYKSDYSILIDDNHKPDINCCLFVIPNRWYKKSRICRLFSCCNKC